MSTQVRERPRLDLKSFKAPSVVHTLRPAEVVAAGLAIGLVIMVILYYFLALAPVLDRLATVQKEAADQNRLIAAQPPASQQRAPSQKQQIQDAKDSLANFEANYLKPMAQGRIDMINEINQLARADNLQLGGGIDMHAMYRGWAPDGESQGSNKKKETEALDVFPRVQFHFVVKGNYKELRKFMRDLEASKQYIVVDSVNLATTEQKQGRAAKGAPVGLASGLSLTISMNAYFRP